MEQWQQLRKDGLIKGLGLVDSTTLVMGSMIGSGVFIVAADISRQVQSPGLLMMTWVVTALLTLIAALSYGELAAAMPHAGGQYVYLREAFGPLAGFLFGWTHVRGDPDRHHRRRGRRLRQIHRRLLPLDQRPELPGGQRRLRRHYSATARHRRHRLAHLEQHSRHTHRRHGAERLHLRQRSARCWGWWARAFWWAATREAVAGNFTDFWRNAGWSFDSVRLVGVAMVGALFSSDAWNNVTFTAGEVRNPQTQSAALAGARRGASSPRCTSPATSSTSTC